MRDLSDIEQRIRMANPAPDISSPPMPVRPAAATLLDIEARSIEMETQQQQTPVQPLPEAPKRNNRFVGLVLAAAVVIALVIISVAVFAGGDDHTELDVADQPAAAPEDTTEPAAPEEPATEPRDFCVIAEEVYVLFDPPRDVGADRSAAARALLDEWEATAPTGLEDEMARSTQAWRNFLDVFDAADWVDGEHDREAWNAAWTYFSSPSTEEAGNALDEWADVNCPQDSE